MGIYKEAIDDNSVWLTATPSDPVKKLPFYITEIGHFFAFKEYCTEREFHDSFLFIYTVKGKGKIINDDAELELPPNHAYIVNCRRPHKYFAADDDWEFIWFHFDGSGISIMRELLYRNDIRAIRLHREIEQAIYSLMDCISDTSLIGSLKISNKLHSIINDIFNAQIEPAQNHFTPHYNDIAFAAEFIRKNYAKPIVINDILSQIHMSKYHFIRVFHKIMGVSPYSYITNYRINQAKILLHSTDKTIAEISELCGFMDTSNFITHFKKHTGQTPLKYRKDFS